MGHIQRRSDRPGWRARYIAPDGKERSKTFRRKVDAERFLATVEADKLRGEWVDPAAGRLTVGEWVQEFEKTRSRKRPATREREASTIRAHILPFFANRSLVSIGRPDVQQWVDHLVSKGLAASTLRREYGVLHKLFEEAVDAERILRNPCRKILLPEEESQEQRFLTAREVEDLYEAFHPRYRAMVLVGGYAGLRIGEMAGLRIERVLFMRRQIDVQEGLFEPERGPAEIGRLKTKYSKGKVDLPESLVQELAAYVRTYPPGEGGLVFTSPNGEPLRPRNWRRRYWYPAVEAAGLALPCKPHCMRHTFVSLLIDQGLSVEKVCEQARHRDPGFTWRVYRHRFEQASSEVSEALERVRKTARRRPVG